MRIPHKDGVTTDWTEKPVYSVGNYSFSVWISARIEFKNFYREYIGYSWRQSTVTDGGCKYNTSWYRNSRTNNYDKWLRQRLYDYKYTSNIDETIVDNDMNDATHADKLTMQHWAHCTRSVVVSSDVFTSHSTWIKSFALVFHSHPIHGHAQRFLSVFSPSLSTSCSISSSSFSSWLTVTPWQWTPCATPPTGPSSAWTITSPSQKQSNILLTFGTQVPACAIDSWTWGTRICCRLRSVNAHDQQKRTWVMLKWILWRSRTVLR